MRKKAAAVGAVLAAALLVLVFLSRTIYAYNTPNVTAGSLSHGKLRKTESAKGVVDWADIRDIYAPIDGKVAELLVAEGDAITRGQALARLVFDEENVEEQLAQLANDRARLDMSITAIHEKIARAEKSVADWTAETYDAQAVSRRDIENIESKIAAKQADVAEKDALYAGGTITRKELDTARDELAALQKELSEAQTAFAENEQKAAYDAASKDKDRQKQIENLQYEIDGYRQELRGKAIDVSENEAKQAKLNGQLASYDTSRYIYAEADGVLVSLDIQKGKTVNEDQIIGTYGAEGLLLLECDLPIENNFVAVGDECMINNANHSFRVTVSKLTVVDGKKRVTIKPEAEGIAVGETFEISFAKTSANSYTLVPNAAVNKDSNGHFVYIVQKRDGILGEEYYVQKQSIQIGDSDATNTVVTRGAGFFDPIVTMSDKPFDDNATVVLRNEGDFIVQ